MRTFAVPAVTLFLACSSTAPDRSFDRNILQQIDARIEQAIAEKKDIDEAGCATDFVEQQNPACASRWIH